MYSDSHPDNRVGDNLNVLVNEGIKIYHKISNHENINFVPETRIIAQMKGLSILVKSYNRHIWKIDPILWGIKGQKRNHEIGLIWNLDYEKTINHFCEL